MTQYHLCSLSNRLPWSSSRNELARMVEHRRNLPEPLLDLTVSNPTAVLGSYPHNEIAAAYARITDFSYHPSAFGTVTARESVSAYYAARGECIRPDALLLTASTSEAYSMLFKLLCNTGEEILIPIPSYPLFEHLAALDSVNTRPYRLLYDGSWFPDLEDLERKISTKTRAIAVVSPNNPTGSVLDKAQTAELNKIAARYALPLIWDEVFADYFLQGDRSVCQTPELDVLTFRLNGLSKAAGMPQMKIAWIAVTGPAEECTPVVKALELVADTYLSVGTPVQEALADLFRIGRGIRAELLAIARQNLTTATEVLAGSPAHCLYTEAGWSAIVQFPQLISEERLCTRLLQNYGVIVQPGYFFDMASEAYVVLSLITPSATFAEGMAAVRGVATQI